MATVKYTNHFPSGYWITEIFGEPASWATVVNSASSVTYNDGFGSKIYFKGQSLSVEDGQISGGHLTSARFETAGGGAKTILTMKDLDLDASKLASIQDLRGLTGVMEFLLSGKDTIEGTKGNDLIHGFSGGDTIVGGGGQDKIFGDEGNDRLTGGAASDAFTFAKGDGRDVIIGFDTTGLDHDVIGFEHAFIKSFGDIDLKNRGGDTLIDLRNGDSVLIKDVGVGQLDEMLFAV